MSNKRRIGLARFHFVVEECGNGEYTASCGELDWLITIAIDGEPEILEAPEVDELPPRLTNAVVLAAVARFHKHYSYSS